MTDDTPKFEQGDEPSDRVLLVESQIEEYCNLPPERLAEALATLDPLIYEKYRKPVAKQHGLRVDILDKEVKSARGFEENASELVDGVESWPEPVDGQKVANEIIGTIRRYTVLPEGGDVALALWCMGTYCMDAFKIFPKLCLSSPEKRCGKTVTLEVLNGICNRALLASSITQSVLFRAVEAWSPTLLIDEADTFISSNDEMRGIINSGHTRSTAVVLRSEEIGGKWVPTRFSTWTPMAIAMIKLPPDTILDRSVLIGLRRKLTSERLEKLPFDLFDDYVDLRRKAKRWGDDHMGPLRNHDPESPNLNNDRATDNWYSLLCIADVLRGDWPQLARRSMIALNQGKTEDDGVGTMILTDIRSILEYGECTRISSSDLINRLIEMEDRPWPEWGRGKGLTAAGLARLLKPFGIKPIKMKFGAQSRRGYQVEDFRDAFLRYPSPLEPPLQTGTVDQSSNHAGFGVPPLDKVPLQTGTENQSGTENASSNNESSGGPPMAGGSNSLKESLNSTSRPTW